MRLILGLPEANVEEGRGKIEFLFFCVCQFCNMIFSKIVFAIPNFVKCVPEICLLPCVKIIDALKQLSQNIFILNRNQKI